MAKPLPATPGMTCYQCSQPAGRQKNGVGVCGRHLLPIRSVRVAMVAAAPASAPVAPVKVKRESAKAKAPRAGNRCHKCDRSFMSAPQLAHHAANAKRLCITKS